MANYFQRATAGDENRRVGSLPVGALTSLNAWE